jgi:hypothetical protein
MHTYVCDFISYCEYVWGGYVPMHPYRRKKTFIFLSKLLPTVGFSMWLGMHGFSCGCWISEFLLSFISQAISTHTHIHTHTHTYTHTHTHTHTHTYTVCGYGCGRIFATTCQHMHSLCSSCSCCPYSLFCNFRWTPFIIFTSFWMFNNYV